MKSKILSLMLLAVILSLSMISAAVSFTITPSTITFTDTVNSVDFVINNTGGESATFTIPAIKINDVSITLSKSTFNLTSLATEIIKASITSTDLDTVIGDYSKLISIKAKSTTSTNESTNDLNVELKGGEYCDSGIVGDLEVDRVNFNNLGLGKDDEWYLTDEIEVEVRVENTGKEDIDNVVVVWGLYNKKTGDFIIDDEEDDFDIKDGEKETITFSFTLDPGDFDQDYSEGDFIFLVKAYSDDEGEDVQCDWRQEDITIKKDSHYVILTDLTLSSETIPCGNELEVDAEAWNIGDSDEQDVYVMIFNKELGIDERIDIGDLDVLDSKKISFNMKIPINTAEKTYGLEFRVIDEDDDIFQNDDDDEAIFTKILKVEGSCQATTITPAVKITAELDPETPEAIAGKQVIIKATIENTGEDKTTYTISVSGNSAWSTLSAIDPQEITLETRESEEFSIVLDLDSNAEGDKEFKIKATYNEQTTEQEVLLSIEKPTAGITGSVIGEHIKSNWFVYLIAVINIILIIAIIAVVKSMATSKTSAR